MGDIGSRDLCRLSSAAGSPGDSVKAVEELDEGCSILIGEKRTPGVKGKSIPFIIRTDQKWSKMFLQLNQLPSNQPGVWSWGLMDTCTECNLICNG